MPLTLPEELLLLMLDDKTGRLNEAAGPASNYAIAAAILAELALQDRVDSDPQRMFVTNRSATGDSLLDSVLARMTAEPTDAPQRGEPAAQPHTSRWWIEVLARDADGYRDQLFARLVQRGILREEQGRFLWIFPERRYPVISDKEEREVKARLMGVIFQDEIPEPRDALLIGLVRAAGLLPLLLAPDALDAAQPRIDAVANLEELSRSLGNAVRDIFVEMARYTPMM
ncbi:GPP34 family phosphoprotein [Roseomonas sp. CCTCC AB2023176]|uniref:GOLPH3/VPS74 family protein n=1 Tax=Roseomonas sp. CCTCC AB2023176 TaxID=3342640 RepID=UPI0035E16E50